MIGPLKVHPDGLLVSLPDSQRPLSPSPFVTKLILRPEENLTLNSLREQFLDSYILLPDVRVVVVVVVVVVEVVLVVVVVVVVAVVVEVSVAMVMLTVLEPILSKKGGLFKSNAKLLHIESMQTISLKYFIVFEFYLIDIFRQ